MHPFISEFDEKTLIHEQYRLSAKMRATLAEIAARETQDQSGRLYSSTAGLTAAALRPLINRELVAFIRTGRIVLTLEGRVAAAFEE